MSKSMNDVKIFTTKIGDLFVGAALEKSNQYRYFNVDHNEKRCAEKTAKNLSDYLGWNAELSAREIISQSEDDMTEEELRWTIACFNKMKEYAPI